MICINTKKCIRKDYITRIIIIIIEKYKLNDTPQIMDYNTFYKETKNTISVMAGNTKLKVVEEIINDEDDILPGKSDNDIDNGNEEIKNYIEPKQFIENTELSFSSDSGKDNNSNYNQEGYNQNKSESSNKIKSDSSFVNKGNKDERGHLNIFTFIFDSFKKK